MSILYKCEKCSSTLFEEVRLFQLTDKGVPSSVNSGYEHFSNSVPILKCFKCGKEQLKDVSLYGTKYDSPDISLHKDLLKILKERDV